MPHQDPSTPVMTTEQAARFIPRPRLATEYDRHGYCPAATCANCTALWRFDQLLHPTVGYVPDSGPVHAHMCPMCHTDLTDLVELHVTCCDTARDRT